MPDVRSLVAHLPNGVATPSDARPHELHRPARDVPFDQVGGHAMGSLAAGRKAPSDLNPVPLRINIGAGREVARRRG